METTDLIIIEEQPGTDGYVHGEGHTTIYASTTILFAREGDGWGAVVTADDENRVFRVSFGVAEQLGTVDRLDGYQVRVRTRRIPGLTVMFDYLSVMIDGAYVMVGASPTRKVS